MTPVPRDKMRDGTGRASLAENMAPIHRLSIRMAAAATGKVPLASEPSQSAHNSGLFLLNSDKLKWIFCTHPAIFHKNSSTKNIVLYFLCSYSLYYTLSEAWSGVNWADLMAAQGTFGTDFYDRSTRTIVGTML